MELEEKIQRAVDKVMESKKTELEPQHIIKDGDYIYFRGEKYQKVKPPEKHYDVIAEWWDEVFTEQSSINELVNRIENWLPKEHDTNSYKWNECIQMIKSKLR